MLGLAVLGFARADLQRRERLLLLGFTGLYALALEEYLMPDTPCALAYFIGVKARRWPLLQALMLTLVIVARASRPQRADETSTLEARELDDRVDLSRRSSARSRKGPPSIGDRPS